MQAPALFDTGHRTDFVAAIFLAVANDVSERQKGLHGTRSTRVTTRRGRSVIRAYFFLYSESVVKSKARGFLVYMRLLIKAPYHAIRPLCVEASTILAGC